MWQNTVCALEDSREPKDPSLITVRKVDDPWTVDKALKAASLNKPANTDSPIGFFHVLERLKTTKRAGWRRFGILQGESVADHMHRMAIMAMLAPLSLGLDVSKCIRMALIHDVGESIVGDIMPSDNILKPEKARREILSMEYLTKNLLGNVPSSADGDGTGATTAERGAAGEEMLALWHEFEAGETLESKFVQDLDKVELLLQMTEYEKRAEGAIDLSEFTYVRTKMRLPETIAWADSILAERNAYRKARADKTANGAKAEDDELVEMKKFQDQYYDEN